MENPSYDLGIVSPNIPSDFLETNNTFEFARNLGIGDQVQSQLTIHTPGDDDYYRWRAPAAGWMSAELEFLHEVGARGGRCNGDTGCRNTKERK